MPARRGGTLTIRNHITKNVDMNRNYLRAIPREWRTISRAFTALGDEHRQRILLTFERGERLNVGQIVEVSTLSRSAVSHHLRLLREAGVLASAKSGKEVYYWIDKVFLEEALGSVLEYIRRKA
jgi:DNA-binding transcriptional ArsR family regulator